MPLPLVVYPVSEKDIHEAVNGICLCCGEIQYGGVEPDARDYNCEWCNADSVYGLEEALLIGRVRMEEVGSGDD